MPVHPSVRKKRLGKKKEFLGCYKIFDLIFQDSTTMGIYLSNVSTVKMATMQDFM